MDQLTCFVVRFLSFHIVVVSEAREDHDDPPAPDYIQSNRMHRFGLDLSSE